MGERGSKLIPPASETVARERVEAKRRVVQLEASLTAAQERIEELEKLLAVIAKDATTPQWMIIRLHDMGIETPISNLLSDRQEGPDG